VDKHLTKVAHLQTATAMPVLAATVVPIQVVVAEMADHIMAPVGLESL
jgi:hypothetical protein